MPTAATKDRLHFPRSSLADLILKGFAERLQPASTIFAPRRKGKTTFVHNDLIPMAVERGFLVASADLWLYRDHPERVIANALHEAIYGSGFVRRNLMRLIRPGQVVKSVEVAGSAEGANVKAEFGDDTALGLQEMFERFRRLGKGRALLIIDEVQHLATRKEFENLTATLRTLLQSGGGEVFALFTGSSQHGLARMFRRSKAPFYQFGSEVAFPDLGREFAEHLGRLYREVTGRDWQVDEAFDLYVARGMMPKYLRELYSLSVSQNLSVSQADKIVWGSMLDDGQFAALVADLPAIDQAVLVGILCGESLFSADFRERLADELPSQQAPTPQAVQVALKRLQRRDLVGNTDHGEWMIEDAAMESYLRRLLIDGETDED
jgi:uncharacterized protein